MADKIDLISIRSVLDLLLLLFGVSFLWLVSLWKFDSEGVHFFPIACRYFLKSYRFLFWFFLVRSRHHRIPWIPFWFLQTWKNENRLYKCRQMKRELGLVFIDFLLLLLSFFYPEFLLHSIAYFFWLFSAILSSLPFSSSSFSPSPSLPSLPFYQSPLAFCPVIPVVCMGSASEPCLSISFLLLVSSSSLGSFFPSFFIHSARNKYSASDHLSIFHCFFPCFHSQKRDWRRDTTKEWIQTIPRASSWPRHTDRNGREEEGKSRGHWRRGEVGRLERSEFLPPRREKRSEEKRRRRRRKKKKKKKKEKNKKARERVVLALLFAARKHKHKSLSDNLRFRSFSFSSHDRWPKCTHE